MSLKKQLSELEAKLKALHLRIKKCDEIIASREKQAIDRQPASIISLAGEIDQLRGSIVESKFSQGESEETVEVWSDGIEKELNMTDAIVEKLSKCLDAIVKEKHDFEREEPHGKDLAYEKQLLDQKLEAALKQKELEEKRSVVKLPKLSMTPFNGTVID